MKSRPSEQSVLISRVRSQVGAYSIHYRVAGRADGEVVVLVHGLAVSSDYLQPLMRELAHRGFRVFAPDLPGHGFSDKPQRALTVPQAAQVLYQWAAQLGLTGKVHLAGHSMGGQIVVEAAVTYPLFARSLTLISVTGGSGVRSLAGEIAGLTLDAFMEKPGMVGLAVRNYFKSGFSHTLALAQHHLKDDMRAKLQLLAALPVLIVWAERDTVTPLSFGRELRQKLPQACLVVVPGSSHASLVYAEPGFLGRAMHQFLGELSMQCQEGVRPLKRKLAEAGYDLSQNLATHSIGEGAVSG